MGGYKKRQLCKLYFKPYDPVLDDSLSLLQRKNCSMVHNVEKLYFCSYHNVKNPKYINKRLQIPNTFFSRGGRSNTTPDSILQRCPVTQCKHKYVQNNKEPSNAARRPEDQPGLAQRPSEMPIYYICVSSVHITQSTHLDGTLVI